ncbi:MAG TPA: hypothetical protein VD862_02645 [Candidatus Paceibacterota bacterium]|nr:hypothetical protein [Candidatus Paceibacterota bacterium]
MSEAGDYAPAAWARQTSFRDARKAYDSDVGRGYASARSKNVSAASLVPDGIETESTHPMFIRTDVTGSMSGWPNTIFSKMGYLHHELATEYLSEDYAVSFGAISDVSDSYPLQVRPFASGEGLKENLKPDVLLVTNGGSGPGSYCEAHSVAALYDIRNAKTPKSIITPPYIIITDEMPYTVTPDDAGYAKVELKRALTADKIFEELMAQYAVYVILKPYGGESLTGDRMDSVTQQVYERWKGIVGAERIAMLPEADRVVDVIFGILAAWSGRIDYFKKEIEERQTKKQVTAVYTALESIHKLPSGTKSVKKLPPGSSQLRTRKKS